MRSSFLAMEEEARPLALVDGRPDERVKPRRPRWRRFASVAPAHPRGTLGDGRGRPLGTAAN
jgi:hypothetical protein